jgi:FixJ family two-component response regulator
MPEKRFTVFVVDDDESILRALKRLLKSDGYHVLTFGSAEDLLESPSLGDEGCLVLDIRLPGMTGLELQEKLSSSGARYGAILMTAHDNPQWQEKAKAAGAIAYLRKPFDQQALLDAVRRCRQQTGTSGANP